MERRSIPKDYYRDIKCEEIERMIREDPDYDGWRVMRLRASGGLSDYEASFEIQNAKGRRVTELSESEIDLLISSGTLIWLLENARRLGFFSRFGKRAPYVIILTVLSLPFVAFVVVTYFFQYIRSLPSEQALLGFLGFFGILLFFVGILCLSQRNANKPGQKTSYMKSRREPTLDNLDDILDKVDELKDLRQNDPAEYIRRLKELNDE